MKQIKLAIIGAGSSYTPELLEKLGELRECLPVSDICLMDIDPRRLEIIYGFSQRFMKNIEYEIHFSATTDWAEAIKMADFVIT